jgi:predicted dehydrogenase
MSELRAGVIGLGMMGRNHARVFHELDGVELVGIADPEGDKFGIARTAAVHATPEGLIEAGVDLAVVAAPTEDHERLGLMLAEAGVHALLEKPVAATSEAALRLAHAFDDAGLVGCVGHIERFNPALQELKRRLQDGQIGDVFQISTHRKGPFPARIKDVGVIKDLATHDIDLTAWVAGSSFKTVSAYTAFKTGRDHEDLVAATCELANGVITNHLVNWLTPTKERMTMVTGTRGLLVADTLTADLTYFANADVPTEWNALSALRGVSEGDMVRYAFPKPEPLKTELAAFRDAVLGLEAETVSLHAGYEVVLVAEAMLESARTSASVRLSDIPR